MSILSKILGSSPKPTEDQTMEIIERYLTGDFRAFPMAELRTPEDAVLSVAKQIGVPIPADVLAHLTGQFPGIYVEAKEEVWPRAKEFVVGPFWSFLYGLHTFTASPESEDWMRIDFVAKQLHDETGKKVLPVLKIVGDADIYCVNDETALVRFNHELGEFEPIDLGFFELFEREIRELGDRTERKKWLANPLSRIASVDTVLPVK